VSIYKNGKKYRLVEEKKEHLYEIHLLGNENSKGYYGVDIRTYVIACSETGARTKINGYLINNIGYNTFKIVEVKDVTKRIACPIVNKNLDFFTLYEEYKYLKQIEKEYKQLKKELKQNQKTWKYKDE